jgi:hypothetical protein
MKLAPNSYHVEKRRHNVVVGLTLFTWTGNLVGWLACAELHEIGAKFIPCGKEAAQCCRWFLTLYLDRESGRLTRLCGTWENGAKTYHVEKRLHNVVVAFDSYLDRESGRLTRLCGTLWNWRQNLPCGKEAAQCRRCFWLFLPGQGIWWADSPMRDLRKWHQILTMWKRGGTVSSLVFDSYLGRESGRLTRLCGTSWNWRQNLPCGKRSHNVIVGLALTWAGNLVSRLAYAGLEKMAPKLTMWKRGGTMSLLVLTLFTWTWNMVGWLAYAGLHEIGAKFLPCGKEAAQCRRCFWLFLPGQGNWSADLPMRDFMKLAPKLTMWKRGGTMSSLLLTLFTWTGNLVGWFAYAGLEEMAALFPKLHAQGGSEKVEKKRMYSGFKFNFWL